MILISYQITCCSTADLPAASFQQYAVLWVPFHFIIDGETYPDDLGHTMPFDAFYQRIHDGALPTTSQVNVGEFNAFWQPLLAAGKDILHLSLSSGISGEYNAAQAAAAMLREEYPERQIVVVDSLAASSGYGLLLDQACEFRDAGKTLQEVAALLTQNRTRLHHWFFSTNLSHLKRGGRISSTSAIIGDILHICPLLHVSPEGKLVPKSKVRGKKAVIREMVQRMVQHAAGGTDYSGKCFLSHSACLEDAQAVAGLIEEKFANLNGKVMINNIGTVIGSHTGPGTVALFFWGDERE